MRRCVACTNLSLITMALFVVHYRRVLKYRAERSFGSDSE